MAVTVPAAFELMTSSHDAATLGRGRTGNFTSTNVTKVAGNLPITSNGTQAVNSEASAATGSGSFLWWEFINGGTSINASVNSKVLIFSTQFNAPNRIQMRTLANGGVEFRIGSNDGATPPTTNYKHYRVGGNDTPFGSAQAGPRCIVIDLNDASQESSVGTFSNSLVQTFALGHGRFNQVATGTAHLFFQRAWLFDTEVNGSRPEFTGTGSTWQDLVDAILGTSYTNQIGADWILPLGEEALFVAAPWQIGDGISATTFNDNGMTIVGPSHNNPADPRFRLTSQSMRCAIRLRNNVADVVTLSGTYNYADSLSPDLDFNVSNASTIDLAGSTWIGRGAVTLGSSINSLSVTFDRCGVVNLNGAKLTLSTYKDQTDTHALLLASAQTIRGMDFSGYAGAHAIEISAAGAYTMNGCTFDGSGTAEVENTSGGLVTITVTGGGDVPTITNTGAGSTTVVINSIKVRVTVVDAVTGIVIESARVYMEADSGGPLPSDTSVAITRVGSTATVVNAGHLMASGDEVKISGCDQQEYNGVFAITVIDSNSYSYTVSGTPVSPATGTPVASAVILNGLTDVSGIFDDVSFNFQGNQPVRGRVRMGTAPPYYRSSDLGGSIIDTGLFVEAGMISDE